MTPEDILSHDALVLSRAQREAYFENGFVSVEGLIPADWLDRLKAVSDDFLEQSRTVAQSNEAYDLGPAHSPKTPHVRRLRAPVDRDPIFWEFASNSILTEVAADLVGPDVKYHSGKLNYKWRGGGEVVKWHQDINAWPHTNYSPVTIGVYFHDAGSEDGPLACVPGSHEGELYSHFDDAHCWTGAIGKEDLKKIDLDSAVESTGPAGSIVALNCRTVHGSMENRSEICRALLLNVFSSADAYTWMPAPTPTRRTGDIVHGKPARWSHVDPRPCPVPPNWAKEGYGSIFAAQHDGRHAEAD